MKYYSTNKQAPEATLEEVVVKGACRRQGAFHALYNQNSATRVLR